MNNLPHACPERVDKRFKRLDSRLVTILMPSHNGALKKGVGGIRILSFGQNGDTSVSDANGFSIAGTIDGT